MAPADRATLEAATSLDDFGRDGMVHHPPGYYVLIAAGTAALGGETLRWDRASLAMRLLSAALLAGAVPFVIGSVRWITGSATAGVGGGMSLFTVPFFTNMGGLISNDVLLITTATACLYFAIRAWRATYPARWMVLLSAVALGIALLSKGFALFLLPTFAILCVLLARRWHKDIPGRFTEALWPMLVAFLVGGWWWLRNLIVLGVVQPSRYGAREATGEQHEMYDFVLFFTQFWIRFNRLFWGRGAREDMALPAEIVDTAGVILLVLMVLALTVSRHRFILAVLLLFPAVTVAVLFMNAHGIYWDFGRHDRGVQGRYVFAGIVAYAAILAVVVHPLVQRLSTRMRTFLMAIGSTVALTVTWVAITWVFVGLWHQVDKPGVVRRGAAEAIGVAEGVYPVLVSLTVIMHLVFLLMLVRWRFPEIKVLLLPSNTPLGVPRHARV
ncbi:ArnT family glycosyltransferase [Sanguibacter sp. Z1732]|uniref:ArnT family glycosyltransferase n=1 Tax=Sanguibacter sp. Z1732 TaxID=3435412 RepID=UPI003D9C956A